MSLLDRLPGGVQAEELGYSLRYCGGDYKSATYIKDGVFLDIWEKAKGDNVELAAKISLMDGMITVSTFDFAFPHKSFHAFEQKILDMKRLLGI